MKHFTEEMVSDIIRIKFGLLVSERGHISYVSNRVLGQIFGCSGSKIRQLYLARFEAINAKKLPLQKQMERRR